MRISDPRYKEAQRQYNMLYTAWTHAVDVAPRSSVECMGRWLRNKYRRIAVERGTYHSARLMRKQGIPLSLALKVLL